MHKKTFDTFVATVEKKHRFYKIPTFLPQVLRVVPINYGFLFIKGSQRKRRKKVKPYLEKKSMDMREGTAF